MRTSESSSQQPSAAERFEEVAVDVGFVGALTLRAVEVGTLVLIGLLVAPPLFILLTVVVLPLAAVTVVVGLIAALVATPYLIVRHLPGHRPAVLWHRFGRAFHALLDIAPRRVRRSHLAR